MHESGIHIALAAERLGTFLGIPVTNTLVMSFIVLGLVTALAVLVPGILKLVPGRSQAILELVVAGGSEFAEKTLENAPLARRISPLLLAIFVFILTANLLEFLPGVGSLVVHTGEGETVPLLRSLNTDLNATLALAIVAFVAIEIVGLSMLGAKSYLGKFLTLKSPLACAIGRIDLISELARLISFSFRLFGNIFAGEVLIGVITFFLPFVAPVPMMLFEVMVAFIQAGIFALLVLFFMKIAAQHH